MTLKRNKIDLFILSFALIFIVLIVIVSNILTGNVNGKIKYVVVSIDGEDRFKYSLDENRVIELKKKDYPTLLGDMIIEIKDNRVRVKEEESPKNYCSKQGWIGSVATPIVCLPNSVVVTIIGQNDSDMDWQV